MKASVLECHIFTYGLSKQEDWNRKHSHYHQDLLHNTLYEEHKQWLKAKFIFPLEDVDNPEQKHNLEMLFVR